MVSRISGLPSCKLIFGMVLLLTLASTPVSALAASTSDQVQSCAQRELVRPYVKTARLINPGKNTQSDIREIHYPATPDECRGVVQRNFQYEVVLTKWIREHGKLHRVIAKMERWYGTRFTQEEAGGTQVVGASAGPVDRYQCSAGKARTKLLLRNRGTITDVASHRIIRRKIWETPFQIVGRVGKHRHVGKRGC